MQSYEQYMNMRALALLAEYERTCAMEGEADSRSNAASPTVELSETAPADMRRCQNCGAWLSLRGVQPYAP